MISTELAVAFGAACKLTADLIENLNDTAYACHDRAVEIGGYTEPYRNVISDMSNAIAAVRNTLGPEMTEAYRKVYAEEIATAALYD